MLFLTFFGVVFGRGGVGFLLASALAGAKAEVEKLKKSMGFYSVICLCALCARIAQTKGKKEQRRNIEKKLRYRDSNFVVHSIFCNIFSVVQP